MSNAAPSRSEVKRPEALLYLYMMAAIVSFVVILTLAGFSIHRIYSQYIINNAEEDAITISKAILADETEFLFVVNPLALPHLEIVGDKIEPFDVHIRKFLQPFNIVKIKIYNLEKTIIYSTDPAIIGIIDSDNPRLQEALLGHNNSKLERKDEATDLTMEKRFDIDVVETYVAVWKNGAIAGCFEIYMDVTKYRSSITKIVTISVAALALILCFVFIPSLLLIRRGTIQLKKTQEELVNTLLINREIEKQQAQEELEYQANHDALTHLPNRILLADRLQQELLQSQHEHRQLAILFVDLDKFKFVNDSLGHTLGDRLLKIIARRLTECVRANDTVARHGGDEFVIILPARRTDEDVVKVVENIHAALSRPLRIDEHELEVSCSVGIGIFPKDGKDAQELLKNAEAAMFSAKDLGPNSYCFFTVGLAERTLARMTMEKQLRRALDRQEFLLHYQPQVDLETGRVTGVEALLRWQNPELGLVSPGTFIPLAEDTGLIVPIGEWVLQEACIRNKAWQEQGLVPLVMAVNLSPRQFWLPGLIDIITRILRDSRLEPRYLELEIIESMVMRDVKAATIMLDELKRLGVNLSIDDFGTGYSSLGHLQRFPFDKLKMDISFVREVTHNPSSAAIAKTIIAMAHNLNLAVIAEGVETKGQLDYLRTHGCDEMQGFYFSRPLPPDEFAQLLRDRRGLQLPNRETTHRQRTVLLVDDEPIIIDLLQLILAEDGYRILSTTDARQGFELLASNRVGVVVSDQRMPGMNGIEFLSRVREIYPDTVRIAMSGAADTIMVTDAINQGAIYKFLTKPMDHKLLRQSIADAYLVFEAANPSL
jgi:diguanylate cyclase (GGDEF)-like protein